MPLTLDTLDKAIKAVGETHYRNISAIYLNTNDWEEACQAVKAISGIANVNINMAFGIKVVPSPMLERGTFILEYQVCNIGQTVGWELVGKVTND